MKKRWGTMLLAGLLGTALLSGCGSSASDSASSAAESNPSEKIGRASCRERV